MDAYPVSAATRSELGTAAQLCTAAQERFWHDSRPRVEWSASMRQGILDKALISACRIPDAGPSPSPTPPIRAVMLTHPRPVVGFTGGVVTVLGLAWEAGLTDREKMGALCSLLLWAGPQYIAVGVKRGSGLLDADITWLPGAFDQLGVTRLVEGRRGARAACYRLDVDLPSLMSRAAEVLERL